MLDLVAKLKGLRGESGAEFKLVFNVPQPISQESLPELGKLQAALKDVDAGNKREGFDACRREARKLSRCTLPTAKRIPISEDFVKRYMPLVITYRGNYSKDGGVPDSDLRQEILDAVGETLRLLIDSYKIAFKALYSSPGRGRIGGVSELAFCAFRILELVKVQQQILGLRFELLPALTWQVVNSVFHAMLIREEVDTKIATVEAEAGAFEAPKAQTIRDMYLAVQLMAKFDTLRWPTDWQAFLRTYCKSVDWLAEVGLDIGIDLQRGMSVVYAYDLQPARIARSPHPEDLGPSVIINWNKLHNKVTQDFLAFFNPEYKGELSYFQKKLATLPFNVCLSIVQLQFQCVTNERPEAAFDSGAGTACDLRIFIGFKAVYQLLQNIHTGRHKVGARLDDVLAKRSAVFAEDHVATVETVWFLQFQDERILRLKTQETQFTTSMNIGMMAAFGFGDDGIAKPQCGVISRIYRPAPRTVIVDILKHGEYIDPTVVSTDPTAFDNNERKAGLLLGAIVVRDPSGTQGLMLPPLSTLHENTELAMMRGSQRLKTTLTKLRMVTRDFFLFRMNVAS